MGVFGELFNLVCYVWLFKDLTALIILNLRLDEIKELLVNYKVWKNWDM